MISAGGYSVAPLTMAWTISIFPKNILENNCKEKQVNNHKQKIKCIFLQHSLGKTQEKLSEQAQKLGTVLGYLWVRKLRSTYTSNGADKIFFLCPDVCHMSLRHIRFRRVPHYWEKLSRSAPGCMSRFFPKLYQAEKVNQSLFNIFSSKHLFTIYRS